MLEARIKSSMFYLLLCLHETTTATFPVTAEGEKLFYYELESSYEYLFLVII